MVGYDLVYFKEVPYLILCFFNSLYDIHEYD